MTSFLPLNTRGSSLPFRPNRGLKDMNEEINEFLSRSSTRQLRKADTEEASAKKLVSSTIKM